MNVRADHHCDLSLLAAVAQAQPDWRWYAIADSAQNKALPAALLEPGAQVRSLLGAVQGTPLAEKSPHLASLPAPSAHRLQGGAWQAIAQLATRQPCVTILASLLPFEALYAQLRQFAEIRLPDDEDMFFAFWDPAILGTLLGQADDATLHVPGPVFDAAQRAMLCGGLAGWWYWDRDGAMHAVDIAAPAPPVRLAAPLKLSQEQVDALVEASVPDHVLFYVDLNQPQLLADLPPRARYGYVKRALDGARELGLVTMMDLVNYVCATLIHGNRWRQDPAIAALLARVRGGTLAFSDAMKQLP